MRSRYSTLLFAAEGKKWKELEVEREGLGGGRSVGVSGSCSRGYNTKASPILLLGAGRGRRRIGREQKEVVKHGKCRSRINGTNCQAGKGRIIKAP